MFKDCASCIPHERSHHQSGCTPPNNRHAEQQTCRKYVHRNIFRKCRTRVHRDSCKRIKIPSMFHTLEESQGPLFLFWRFLGHSPNAGWFPFQGGQTRASNVPESIGREGEARPESIDENTPSLTYVGHVGLLQLDGVIPSLVPSRWRTPVVISHCWPQQFQQLSVSSFR